MTTPAELVEPLPRDLRHNGAWLTEMFRQRRRGEGGIAIYLQNSKPGEVTGHVFKVFQIDIVNEREVIGSELAVEHSLDKALGKASAHYP